MSRYRFGSRSLERLSTCHPVLQEILRASILYTTMDFTIVSGHRGKEEQNELVLQGRSKLRYPESRHNHTAGLQDVNRGWATTVGVPLSLAADVAPWYRSAPHIRWDRPEEFRWLAGFIMGIGEPIARTHGFMLRWGGDWDRDGDHSARDNPFMDLPHIELRPGVGS